jgi:hypothetical protein
LDAGIHNQSVNCPTVVSLSICSKCSLLYRVGMLFSCVSTKWCGDMSCSTRGAAHRVCKRCTSWDMLWSAPRIARIGATPSCHRSQEKRIITTPRLLLYIPATISASVAGSLVVFWMMSATTARASASSLSLAARLDLANKRRSDRLIWCYKKRGLVVIFFFSKKSSGQRGGRI